MAHAYYFLFCSYSVRAILPLDNAICSFFTNFVLSFFSFFFVVAVCDTSTCLVLSSFCCMHMIIIIMIIIFVAIFYLRGCGCCLFCIFFNLDTRVFAGAPLINGVVHFAKCARTIHRKDAEKWPTFIDIYHS